MVHENLRGTTRGKTIVQIIGVWEQRSVKRDKGIKNAAEKPQLAIFTLHLESNLSEMSYPFGPALVPLLFGSSA